MNLLLINSFMACENIDEVNCDLEDYECLYNQTCQDARGDGNFELMYPWELEGYDQTSLENYTISLVNRSKCLFGELFYTDYGVEPVQECYILAEGDPTGDISDEEIDESILYCEDVD